MNSQTTAKLRYIKHWYIKLLVNLMKVMSNPRLDFTCFAEFAEGGLSVDGGICQ